jgi:Tfp pilus assembly protein PilP
MRLLSRLRILLPLGCALFLLPACGGGDEAPVKGPYKEEEASPEDAKKAQEAKLKEMRGKKKGALAVEMEAKPEWDMLAPHFFQFVGGIEGELHSKSVTWKFKDAFAPRTEKFYPPVEEKKDLALTVKAKSGDAAKKKEEKTVKSILDGILAPVGVKTEGEEPTLTEVDAVKDPLTKYELKKYSFRIIMTGIANPEAMAESPDGNTYVVRINDRLGSEGGRVVDIFKHKILVSLPDVPEPLEISLAPDSLPDSFVAQ